MSWLSLRGKNTWRCFKLIISMHFIPQTKVWGFLAWIYVKKLQKTPPDNFRTQNASVGYHLTNQLLHTTQTSSVSHNPPDTFCIQSSSIGNHPSKIIVHHPNKKTPSIFRQRINEVYPTSRKQKSEIPNNSYIHLNSLTNYNNYHHSFAYGLISPVTTAPGPTKTLLPTMLPTLNIALIPVCT